MKDIFLKAAEESPTATIICITAIVIAFIWAFVKLFQD